MANLCHFKFGELFVVSVYRNQCENVLSMRYGARVLFLKV